MSFDRDRRAKSRVLGAPHHAHPALTNGVLEPVTVSDDVPCSPAFERQAARLPHPLDHDGRAAAEELRTRADGDRSAGSIGVEAGFAYA